MNEEVDFRPEEFHHALDSELAALDAPPLVGLVGLAAQRGRRQRRWRTAGAVAGSVTAVAVTAGLLAGALGGGGTRTTEAGAAGRAAVAVPSSPSASPSNSVEPSSSVEPTGSAAPSGSAAPAGPPVPSASATPTRPATPAASGSPRASGAAGLPSGAPTPAPAPSKADPLVPTTAASLLAAVLQSLPAGLTTDHYAANPGHTPIGGPVDYPAVFSYVNTAGGTGRISVSAYQADSPMTCGSTATTVHCFTDAAGELVQVETIPGNCIQHSIVTVQRRDGFSVGVTVSSCLNWDGSQNPPAVPALTQDQAVALASSPLIGTRMPASYVLRADAKYPNLSSPQ